MVAPLFTWFPLLGVFMCYGLRTPGTLSGSPEEGENGTTQNIPPFSLSANWTTSVLQIEDSGQLKLSYRALKYFRVTIGWSLQKHLSVRIETRGSLHIGCTYTFTSWSGSREGTLKQPFCSSFYQEKQITFIFLPEKVQIVFETASDYFTDTYIMKNSPGAPIWYRVDDNDNENKLVWKTDSKNILCQEIPSKVANVTVRVHTPEISMSLDVKGSGFWQLYILDSEKNDPDKALLSVVQRISSIQLTSSLPALVTKQDKEPELVNISKAVPPLIWSHLSDYRVLLSWGSEDVTIQILTQLHHWEFTVPLSVIERFQFAELIVVFIPLSTHTRGTFLCNNVPGTQYMCETQQEGLKWSIIPREHHSFISEIRENNLNGVLDVYDPISLDRMLQVNFTYQMGVWSVRTEASRQAVCSPSPQDNGFLMLTFLFRHKMGSLSEEMNCIFLNYSESLLFDTSSEGEVDMRICESDTPSNNNCREELCLHGGECLPGQPFCACPPQYQGRYCEILRGCLSGECQHGGNCSENPSSCTCPPDYQGKYCEIPLRCVEDRCLNGGKCLETTSSPCVCLEGYHGDRCQHRNFTYCSLNSCPQHEICVAKDSYPGYECVCPKFKRGIPLTKSGEILLLSLVSVGVLSFCCLLSAIHFGYVFTRDWVRYRNKKKSLDGAEVQSVRPRRVSVSEQEYFEI